jgi:predicted small secreted protein
MELKKMVKKVILYIILIILGISLASCQTIQGVGGDIQWTAEAFGGKKTEGGDGEAEALERKKAKAKAEEQESEGWGGKKANVGEDRY